MNENPAASHLGEKLLGVGWRQGSVFHSENLSFPFVGISLSGSSEKSGHDAEAAPAGPDFIVVTQDCDIVAPPDVEPFIEVMACKRLSDHETPPKLNTAREFLVQRGSGLVAVTKTRLPVPKEVFLKLSPTDWPGNSTEFHFFREWLGRRYTRPAVPDSLVNLLDRPLAERLSRFARRHSESWNEFNMAFSEIRATVQDQEEPPYEIELVLIAEDQALTEPQAQALDAVSAEIRETLQGKEGLVLIEIRVVDEGQISVAEYKDTRPIFLDDFSFAGSELHGVTSILSSEWLVVEDENRSTGA